MKKLSITLLAFVLALGCALTLSACGSTVKIEFIYTLNDDGESYAITGAKFNGEDFQPMKHKDKMPEEVTVPAEHDGKPVTVIKHMYDGDNVKKVNLPDSIVEIGEFAFSHYSSITSIKIGDNVEKIGGSAFKGIATLETVEFGENSKLKELGTQAFAGTGLKTFKAPAMLELQKSVQMTSIDLSESMFENCTALETIDFSAMNSFVNLGSRFAYNCTSLKTVILPNHSIKISPRAFDKGTADKTTLYMCALELEGAGKISYMFGDELGINDCAFIGNIYFYSETAPTNNVSNWWHYVDGVPTKW